MLSFVTEYCTQWNNFIVLQSDVYGELNLTSCLNVSDCEVEKNYGLQIQVCVFLVGRTIHQWGCTYLLSTS